jgi:hypothetical protein
MSTKSGGCIRTSAAQAAPWFSLTGSKLGPALVARSGSSCVPLALVSNNPCAFLRALAAGGHICVRKAAQLDAPRGGPLDKRGAGSRILDAVGQIDAGELARLDQFAADKVDALSGAVERGLGIEQLRAMMDANFARAGRTSQDRSTLDGRRVADPPLPQPDRIAHAVCGSMPSGTNYPASRNAVTVAAAARSSLHANALGTGGGSFGSASSEPAACYHAFTDRSLSLGLGLLLAKPVAALGRDGRGRQ